MHLSALLLLNTFNLAASSAASSCVHVKRFFLAISSIQVMVMATLSFKTL